MLTRLVPLPRPKADEAERTHGLFNGETMPDRSKRRVDSEKYDREEGFTMDRWDASYRIKPCN